jgi:hypothetical protein
VNGLTDEEQFPSIQVDILDNELAKVFANSNKASVNFYIAKVANYLHKIH